MDKTLFEDLVQSLQEAKAIARGEAEPSRRFVVKRMDVKAIREKTGLSQNQFAQLIQISTRGRLRKRKIKHVKPGEVAVAA